MTNPTIPRALRKAAVYLFAALMTLLTAIAIADWRAQTDPSVSGTLGVPAFLKRDPEGLLVVRELQAASPLAQAGVRNGDRITYDHPGTNLRFTFSVDETVGLTLYQQGTPRHLTLQPASNADLDQTTEIIVALLRWLASGISIILAVAIVRLKGDDAAMRAFAWSLLLNAPAVVTNFLPAGLLQDLCTVLMRPVEQVGGYACFMYFVLRYPDDMGYYRRSWVRTAFVAYTVAFLAVSITSFSLRNGQLTASEMFSSTTRITLSLMCIAIIFASLGVLWLSWRASSGVTRNRIGWIGVCMGLIQSSYLVSQTYSLLGWAVPAIYNGVLSDALGFIAIAGFAYALLRHRVFDFGFAINRALVFTITSTFLLVVFSLTEFAVDKLLHFEGRQKNILFDALVALVIILSFHRIQHWISHKVDYIFFHHWYDATERLQGFIARADHISQPAALREKFAEALDVFTGASGVALYAADADAALLLQHSTLAGAPGRIDADDDLVIALRHTMKVLEPAALGSPLRADLALPMTLRGALVGMLLVGPKSTGQSYRPDQVEQLGKSAHQLALYLEGLRVLELERQTASLLRQVDEGERRLAVNEAIMAELRINNSDLRAARVA